MSDAKQGEDVSSHESCDISSTQLTIRERYMAAANEISQRISLRQQTQIAFVVGVFTVLGWILPGLNDKHTDKAYQLLCALIPMVGIIFTCWTGQNDLVVGLLCSFCRACQQAHDGFTSDGTRPSKPDPWLTPNWFSRTQVWAVQGYLYRALGNVAYSAILFCTTIPMSLVILKNFSGPNDGPAIAIFQVFVSALLLATGIMLPIRWWIQHTDLEHSWFPRFSGKGVPMLIATLVLWAFAILFIWLVHHKAMILPAEKSFALHISLASTVMTMASLVIQWLYTSERIRIVTRGELILETASGTPSVLRFKFRDKTPVGESGEARVQAMANRRLERIGTLEQVAVWLVFISLLLVFLFIFV